MQPQREAAAVVVPRNDSRVAAEVGGVVLHWHADAGATVRRGELLAELDPTDARIARDSARAALAAAQVRRELAREQLGRARALVAQGFLSSELVSAREAESRLAEADAEAARLGLQTAERALAKTRVVAPFDAAVRQRLAQVGETVAPGTPLFMLVQTGGEEVAAQLSPEDADSIQRGQAWRFVVPGGMAAELQLARVARTVTSPARTVEVRLRGAGLVPGQDGRVVWLDPRPHLPAALLVRRGSSLGVFELVEGKARYVRVPGAQEGRAALAPELAAQARIVVEGQQALRDGQAVKLP